MLISDFAMENCFNSRRSAKPKLNNDDASALHFTAFVPINGEVWKLDGLDRQPENLGLLRTSKLVLFQLMYCKEILLTMTG